MGWREATGIAEDEFLFDALQERLEDEPFECEDCGKTSATVDARVHDASSDRHSWSATMIVRCPYCESDGTIELGYEVF